VQHLKPRIIADLAAGDGRLLLEAERIWPRARFVATDIDRAAIERMRRSRPGWALGLCDLRNPLSRARCMALRALSESVSLLLLNPPFSCRGGTRFEVELPGGVSISAGTAISFVLIATQYVAQRGEVVAILPSGSLYNLKDAGAWDYLRTHYQVNVLGTYGKDTFPDSAASTTLVRLSRAQHDSRPKQANLKVTKHNIDLHVQIVRGCCPVHRPRIEAGKPPLVHYTDLRQSFVHINGRRGFGAYRCVNSPAVLIPRVGRMTPSKIALLKAREPVMISDCVIALTVSSQADARAVQLRLLENFATLKDQYRGTGAPFITLQRLRTGLESMGINVKSSDHE
jgi:hypothetical protein